MALVLLITGLQLFAWYALDFPYRPGSPIPAGWLDGLFRMTHRYAAHIGLMALLLHSVSLVRQKRGRGVGHISGWLAGGGLLLFFLWQGVTGYLLPLDRTSQALLGPLLEALPLDGSAPFAFNDRISTRAMVLLAAAHIVPVFVGLGLLFTHFVHLPKPRIWLQSRTTLAIVSGLLLGGALTGDAAQTYGSADFSTIPEALPFDWLLLWPVAFLAKIGPTLFWGCGGLMVFGLLGALGWVSHQSVASPPELDEDKCVGCPLCEVDCPYHAITLFPTNPTADHPWVARIDNDRCTGCSLCVGSCAFGALDMPHSSLAAMRSEALEGFSGGETILFGCKSALAQRKGEAGERVIPLLCGGQLPATLVDEIVRRGAERVTLLTCGPDECQSRHGARFGFERMERKRKPWVHSPVGREKVRLEVADPVRPGAGFLFGLTLALVLFFSQVTTLFSYELDNPDARRIAVVAESYDSVELMVSVDGVEVLHEAKKPVEPLGQVRLYSRIDIDAGVRRVVVALRRPSGVEEVTLSSPFQPGKIITLLSTPSFGPLARVGVVP